MVGRTTNPFRILPNPTAERQGEQQVSTNKELPDELEEAMNEAVQNLLDDGEIGAMIAESGV